MNNEPRIRIKGKEYHDIYDYIATVAKTKGLDEDQFYIYERKMNKRFNEPVEIIEGVEDISGLFTGLESFNQPIVIPNSVKYCDALFFDCISYNQPVKIPANVESCNNMFGRCINFNQPVIFEGNKVFNCDCMFLGCSKFNQSIIIPDSVIECSEMFLDCYFLNSKIIMSENTNNASGFLKNCIKFNQSIYLPDSIETCDSFFEMCVSFNSVTNIPKKAKILTSMFKRCDVFNQYIKIPRMKFDSYTIMTLFEGCYSLNPIKITFNISNLLPMCVMYEQVLKKQFQLEIFGDKNFGWIHCNELDKEMKIIPDNFDNYKKISDLPFCELDKEISFDEFLRNKGVIEVSATEYAEISLMLMFNLGEK